MPELKLDGNGFSAFWDEAARFEQMRFADGTSLRPASECSFFELDGEPAQASLLTGAQGYRLRAEGASGELMFSSGEEVVLHFQPDQGDVQKIGMVIAFPLDTEFHLAEHRNTGRILDKDMPAGESYEARLALNFFLARWREKWIRFRVDSSPRRSAEVHVFRHPSLFTATFSWNAKADACLMAFASLDEAISDYQLRLEKKYGIRKTRENKALPGWVHEVKLIITVDMLRSNWEISHDYEDLRRLSIELREIGCPRHTLFYIPGWQGAYDSTHPTYRPHPELGGEEAFRRMMEEVHRNGFHVMIHTTGWGIDPYHPDIDRLEKLVLKDSDGNYDGWQIRPKKGPPAKQSLKFFTERISMNGAAEARSLRLRTPYIPAGCEAIFSVGGFRGSRARVVLKVGRRAVATPPGWFQVHDEFTFPFPLLLSPGENSIEASLEGGEKPDWEKAWYRIDCSFVPKSPYTSWTWPILRADTARPEYIRIFVENVSGVVRDFGIDAVHVDATSFSFPGDNRKLLLALKEALPDVPIGTEGTPALEELGYWTFSQGATQSLLAARSIPTEQESLPVAEGPQAVYAWLDKPSPVSHFVRDYIWFYPHLCAANAFVPVGKVCNTFPPRQIPPSKEALWRVLGDAKRLGYIPGLRVNYRKYGLDRDTADAIRKIADQG